MTGYYCEQCVIEDQKCSKFHYCECGSPALVWMDGWVECEPCVRKRIKEGK